MSFNRILIFFLVVLNTCCVFAQDNKLSLGIVINPTYASRLLVSSEDDYAEILNDIEGPMFGFDAGVQITVMKRTRIELVTGLLYSRQGFDLGETELRDIDGNTSVVGGKSICDFLQVPVRINYRLKENSQSYLIGGINNDFLLSSQIKQTGDTYPYEIEDYMKGNRTYNIGLHIGFGYDFILSDKITLAVEPNLKYQMMPFRSESDAIDKRHLYTFGLTFNTKFSL